MLLLFNRLNFLLLLFVVFLSLWIRNSLHSSTDTPQTIELPPLSAQNVYMQQFNTQGEPLADLTARTLHYALDRSHFVLTQVKADIFRPDQNLHIVSNRATVFPQQGHSTFSGAVYARIQRQNNQSLLHIHTSELRYEDQP